MLILSIIFLTIGLLFPWIGELAIQQKPQIQMSLSKFISWIQPLEKYNPPSQRLLSNIDNLTLKEVANTTAPNGSQGGLKDEIHNLLEPKVDTVKQILDSNIDYILSSRILEEFIGNHEIQNFYHEHHDTIDALFLVVIVVVLLTVLRKLGFMIRDYSIKQFENDNFSDDDKLASTEIAKIMQIEKEYTRNFSVIPMCKANYNKEEDYIDQLYEKLGITPKLPSEENNVLDSARISQDFETSLEFTSTGTDVSSTDDKKNVNDHNRLSDNSTASQNSSSELFQKDRSESTSLEKDTEILTFTPLVESETSSVVDSGLKHKRSKQLVFKNSSSVLESPNKSNDKNCSPIINITEETVYSSDFSKANGTVHNSYLH